MKQFIMSIIYGITVAFILIMLTKKFNSNEQNVELYFQKNRLKLGCERNKL